MASCEICGKKSIMGRNISHKRGIAGKRWNKRAQVTPRLFVANIQKKTVTLGGIKKTMNICAKCIKRIKKFKAIKTYKTASVL